MRAPVTDFTKQIVNDELAVYICSNLDGTESCDAQLLRAMHVQFLNMDTVCAIDDDCINIYDEPTKSVISSATLANENNIYCLKCNGKLGIRQGSLIIFESDKLKEMIIYSFSRLISNFVDKIFSENN